MNETLVIGLGETLREIARKATEFDDDWWIIGSAAAHLVGADVGEIQDIDLLLSERDALHLLQQWPPPAPGGGPTDQFRSRVFAHFDHLPLPVEIMAGFELRLAGAWRMIAPKTRMRSGEIFTPSVAEQIELLQMMNRKKDQPRIMALQSLGRERNRAF
jgi:hypothetical protein